MTMLDKYSAVVDRTETITQIGRVSRVQGLLIETDGPQTFLGEQCKIVVPQRETHRDVSVWAEVVGLRGRSSYLMPYTEAEGIEVGSPVVGTGETLSVPVSNKLLGRVINSRGVPIDGKGDVGSAEFYPISNPTPHVLTRRSITEQMVTGIRAIDGLVPAGMGQRLGIFSGSGVGKSTLLGMVARNTEADVNVIALIGERGREVKDFLTQDLGPEGLARSVLVVSTSETPPLARLRGAYVATAIAEYFRDQGKNVMLLFDSVTRFARAQREIGLAVGEPPATRGFPPSVFSTLPKLLERCGTSDKGTITGFFAILVEGDDLDEPVSDAVRGILDGHIVLSRRLAQRNHYPAIDVLGSISRLSERVAPDSIKVPGRKVRRLLARYTESEDLINVGAYVRGSDAELDEAVDRMPMINAFLQQAIDEKTSLEETADDLARVAGDLRDGAPQETDVLAGLTSTDATASVSSLLEGTGGA